MKLRHDESGVTLFEAMAVALIIAILIAIAIPTFVAARNRERDKKLVGVDPTELCRDQEGSSEVVGVPDPANSSPWICSRVVLVGIPDIQGYCDRITKSNAEIVVKKTGVHCRPGDKKR